jgi:hypothetical protein
MPKVTYEMGAVSADGYIAGPDGKSDARVHADLGGAAEGGVLADAGLARGSKHDAPRYDLRAALTSLQESVRADESLPRRPVWI